VAVAEGHCEVRPALPCLAALPPAPAQGHCEFQKKKTKSYQILLIKLFLTTARHIPIPLKFSAIKFSVKKSFNIQELLQQKSRRHGTKPMQPSFSRAFQRDQELNLEHPGYGIPKSPAFVVYIPCRKKDSTTVGKMPFLACGPRSVTQELEGARWRVMESAGFRTLCIWSTRLMNAGSKRPRTM
jgi:hypothetical protein